MDVHCLTKFSLLKRIDKHATLQLNLNKDIAPCIELLILD